MDQAIGGEPSGELYEAFKFAEKTHGTANWLIMGPPGMNAEATEILRVAVEKAMHDPETIAETKKIETNPYRHIGWDRASAVLEDIRNADPEIVKFWKERVAQQSQ